MKWNENNGKWRYQQPFRLVSVFRMVTIDVYCWKEVTNNGQWSPSITTIGWVFDGIDIAAVFWGLTNLWKWLLGGVTACDYIFGVVSLEDDNYVVNFIFCWKIYFFDRNFVMFYFWCFQDQWNIYLLLLQTVPFANYLIKI